MNSSGKGTNPVHKAEKAAQQKGKSRGSKAFAATADPCKFELRLESRYDELKWLYCELYHGDMNAFTYFVICCAAAGMHARSR